MYIWYSELEFFFRVNKMSLNVLKASVDTVQGRKSIKMAFSSPNVVISPYISWAVGTAAAQLMVTCKLVYDCVGMTVWE